MRRSFSINSWKCAKYINFSQKTGTICIERRLKKENKMVLDFAKEAIENAATHSINFDELKSRKG